MAARSGLSSFAGSGLPARTTFRSICRGYTARSVSKIDDRLRASRSAAGVRCGTYAVTRIVAVKPASVRFMAAAHSAARGDSAGLGGLLVCRSGARAPRTGVPAPDRHPPIPDPSESTTNPTAAAASRSTRPRVARPRRDGERLRALVPWARLAHAAQVVTKIVGGAKPLVITCGAHFRESTRTRNR